MLRHEALQDLSPDHRDLLHLALHAREIHQSDPHGAGVAGVVRSILHAWESWVPAHLAEERGGVWPLATRTVDGGAALVATVHQHQMWLTEAVAVMDAAHRARGDVRVQLRFFGERLRAAIRSEETLFERVQDAATEAELAALGRASQRFRIKRSRPTGRRGSGCAVPQQGSDDIVLEEGPPGSMD